MTKSLKQQIVISGVGGQGVLFVTRLLAEAAIMKGFSVFTSETHGMAQRGGTVLSHVKVGTFSSPLIRPLQADGLLALKADSLIQHGFYLKPGAWAAVNCSGDCVPDFNGSAFAVDADKLAQEIKSPKSVNLILLGFAIAVSSTRYESNRLFCSLKDIRTVLKNRIAADKKMIAAAMKAVETGYGSLP
ncbi:MAG: 2-oxoacid:acceptor oxidoreductase family protein [Pseudomonadota bacterium]|uniref:2-oxoacid:acceptor oxidoreductase family protein n=1 Tax=Candidatus Desulfatibia profunda TaxID=2841695 RepID=A0A8J6TGW9_9BACT|nr:2-oxoacid:acceptor oxidoreductase family protein [Candidatus Desulfatibia profunda]MBL7178697.1 2-oxoacid:acceptor oxidoreductase family protein [Desulfobacterales bacterium]